MHHKIKFNQQKKRSKNVQIQSTFNSRIAFCKGEASWFGTFLEEQYNEISKPEVVRFRVFLCAKFKLKFFPKSFLLGAYWLRRIADNIFY